MPQQPESPGNDYWANEFDPGTSSNWSFAGSDGITRLSGPSTLSTLEEEDFSAELSRVQLDHVALEAFQSTPHSWTRGPAEIAAFPTPLLTFILLLSGRMHVQLADTSFDLIAGQYVVIDSRDAFTASTSTRTRLVRAVVGLEHLDPALQERGATVPGPLPLTALTDSYIAFISNIIGSTASGRRARGDRLVQATADLTAAVLAEAQQLHIAPDGPAGLRYRIEQYIEDHYTDPALSPETIAAAFHISLRHAHHVFDDDDRTLARFIRDRRLAAVALELRAAPGSVRFDGLAARYGFTSRDTLARAFQHRFGMTLTEYRDGGHRHLG